MRTTQIFLECWSQRGRKLKTQVINQVLELTRTIFHSLEVNSVSVNSSYHTGERLWHVFSWQRLLFSLNGRPGQQQHFLLYMCQHDWGTKSLALHAAIHVWSIGNHAILKKKNRYYAIGLRWFCKELVWITAELDLNIKFQKMRKAKFLGPNQVCAIATCYWLPLGRCNSSLAILIHQLFQEICLIIIITLHASAVVLALIRPSSIFFFLMSCAMPSYIQYFVTWIMQKRRMTLLTKTKIFRSRGHLPERNIISN